mgnify:CR=1 FL=1
MEKIYFIGINGIGMSGLAKIMKCKGYDVKGADICTNYVTEELLSMGITVYNEHDEENVKGSDYVIASTAIKENNPELSYAKNNGITLLKRGELLAKLLNRETGIAVAGTHGKTTTSSMLSAVMLSKDPTIVVGGILPEIKSNARPGKSEYFIAEADESDNSFLYIKPKYSVVTNVEPDHLEHHGTYENIKRSFEKFIDSTEKLALLCKDCTEIPELNIKNKNIIWYSVKREEAHIFATNIRVVDGHTKYEVIKNGKNLGEFELSIPGEHNVSNSLPVIYLAHEMNCNMETVKERLLDFKGANRRYQVIYDNNIRIIDDYAHHPTEIKVTIDAAQETEKGKITLIFQPHRYSRTKFFFDDFAKALGKIDNLILLPIYAASEDNTYGVTSESLAEKIGNGTRVCSEEEIEEMIRNNKDTNDTYIFMGAGSISKLAHDIIDRLK